MNKMRNLNGGRGRQFLLLCLIFNSPLIAHQPPQVRATTVDPIAEERWNKGLLPCVPKGSKSKIVVAMDLHQGVPQAQKDSTEEIDKAKAGNAYYIKEGFPRSQETGSKYIVSAESENLWIFAPMFVAVEYLRKYPSDETGVPPQYRNYARTLAMRSLAQIAMWTEWEKPDLEPKLPKYLKEIRKNDFVRKSVQKLAEAESEESWAQFMKAMADFEAQYFKELPAWNAKKKAYDQVLTDALRAYIQVLSQTSNEKHGEFRVPEADLKAMNDFADGKVTPGPESGRLRDQLFDRFATLRNDSLIRSIADLFCQTKESGKPIYARLGMFHVMAIYKELEKRARASGEEPKSILELDSRALSYEGAEVAMAQSLSKEFIAEIKAFSEKVKKKK